MLDSSPVVRRMAADGLATLLAQPGHEPAVVTAAQAELEACVRREQNADVNASLLEAIGTGRYGSDEDRGRAEQFLVSRLRGPAAEVLGAVKGLEVLFRRSPQRAVPQATRERVRDLVFFTSRQTQPARADQVARIRRLALLALQAARDDDVATLVNAARDADWQVRRLVATRLNLSVGIDQQMVAERLHQDPDFHVRYEVLGPIARFAAQSRLCAPLVQSFDDPAPVVSMRAMDLVTPACQDLAGGLARLTELAGELVTDAGANRWHRPSRALTALARVSPEHARGRLADAVAHSVWQVRAAAAVAAGTLGEVAELKTLAADREPNVRNNAIEALARLKDPWVVDASVAALEESEDHQLLRTAATSLRGAPDERRGEASDALLFALRALTRRADDTSRDPRVAILERLGELLRPERGADLLPWLSDWDDEVVAAAMKAYQGLGPGTPPEVPRLRRYPYQPEETELTRLPRTAQLQLEEGLVVIELLPNVAPVTVARFAALARRGYYDGLTFHRIAPNFVVQGGSPGANEYAGTSRYMRDELGGAPHLRGAVGISTRGRDTGDAQIFIDLVDVPRLDHDYTVFGYVRQGMEVVDRMLEGALIKSVTVR